MTTDPLRLAFGTLTALPVPPPASLDAPVPGRAMALAPLAGAVPGLAAAIVVWLGLHGSLQPPVGAVLAVLVFALATRGLHLDGLADTADGFAASYDREKALTVMRRGDTGPTGLAAVVLVLLLQAAALSQVLSLAVARVGYARGGIVRAALVLVVVAVAARVAIPVMCRRGVPAARPGGLGAAVAGSVTIGPLAGCVLGSLVVCSLLSWAAGLGWWAGAVAVLVVAVAAAALGQRATKRLGGITGDVLGFGVESATALALLTLALIAS